MFHPDTQFLIDHWTGLARGRGARGGIPARAALEPAALGLRLPRTLVAERRGDQSTLRLAGGWIEAFHGGPLKNRPLLSLWRTASHGAVGASVVQSLREARPVVIIAHAGQAASRIEIVIAPLRGPTGQVDQILGLYAPSTTLTLSVDEPRLLTARLSIGVGETARAPLSLATVHGRRLA